MSLFDAEPRSASVTTLTACDCLVLTQRQLYEAIDETPGIAVNIIRLLSRRIRELNQDLNSSLRTQSRDASPQVLKEVSATLMDARPAVEPLLPEVESQVIPARRYEGLWPY